MPEVAILVVLARIVGSFLGIDFVKRMVLLDRKPNAVEHEELCLGTEVGGIADAALGEVFLGPLGDAAGPASVVLTGLRLLDVADED